MSVLFYAYIIGHLHFQLSLRTYADSVNQVWAILVSRGNVLVLKLKFMTPNKNVKQQSSQINLNLVGKRKIKKYLDVLKF